MEEEMEKIDLTQRDFHAYSNDLIASSSHNFRNNLRVFVDFCETNEVMKKIVEPLKSNTKVNIRDWWDKMSKTGGSFVGSKRYEVPTNEEDRIALFYQFILALNTEEYSFETFTVWVYGHRRYNDNIYAFNQDIVRKLIRALAFRLEGIKRQISLQSDEEEVEWDFFVCHASEDKEEVVRPLANALRKEKYKVWYDEFQLKIGDSLRRSIERGLAKSRYGLVILSPYFFGKKWPQDELDGLAAKERAGKKVILPIWHKVDRSYIVKYSPMLAGRYAAKTSDGLDAVIREIQKEAKPLFSKSNINHYTKIQAYLFFPKDTPEKDKNIEYHREYLHHRLIVNFKHRPPRAFYLTPNSCGWTFIEENPDRWISETVTSQDYSIDDPDFTELWCKAKGFILEPRVAEKKDLAGDD